MAPNTPHMLDDALLVERARQNSAMASAWSAYFEHQAMAAQLAHLFRSTKARSGPRKAFAALVEEIEFVSRIDDYDDALEHGKWLLREATRISELDEKRRADYVAARDAADTK